MARAVFGGSGKMKTSMLGGRYSAASSNPIPSGIPQGTPGGIGVNAAGRRPGAKLMVGDEGYLWVLVAIEVALMCWFRRYFRRYHGG